ncbi:hypothetical protein F2Q70_00039467 [Brassica cretica]|uniref:Uncharacterized protein n=1 Tax=Brassica cretica TaxID=69181 RepID=A0A8S9MM47_BRACR|nr:hypothetical protein F2Q70_00039467 [Brassica cretica]KAF2618506.1 hypothetical protein F2Q68_00040168 [Brassica cretica]
MLEELVASVSSLLRKIAKSSRINLGEAHELDLATPETFSPSTSSRLVLWSPALLTEETEVRDSILVASLSFDEEDVLLGTE